MFSSEVFHFISFDYCNLSYKKIFHFFPHIFSMFQFNLFCFTSQVYILHLFYLSFKHFFCAWLFTYLFKFLILKILVFSSQTIFSINLHLFAKDLCLLVYDNDFWLTVLSFFTFFDGYVLILWFKLARNFIRYINSILIRGYEVDFEE